MGDLLVELYDTVVGRLSGGRRDFDFAAEPAAVRRFGLDSSVLSVAVPVAPVATRSRRAHRQAFFLNLLPEGQALARLADRAGVEADDAVGFLRH
ncbi:MAG TPA: HipA N-terminal domain-containing protein, partial [Arachnia sp.]|nr:HipA N-terminal domain-containing protein [Arachnia sp.]